MKIFFFLDTHLLTGFGVKKYDNFFCDLRMRTISILDYSLETIYTQRFLLLNHFHTKQVFLRCPDFNYCSVITNNSNKFCKIFVKHFQQLHINLTFQDIQ